MDYVKLLKDLDQNHILEAYNKASHEERKALEQQIDRLNETYPGGLESYYERALVLLKNSAESVNPYADYNIGKPNGINFSLDKPDLIEHYETIGLKEFNHTAFVLVAGGLGERLGYPGIKVSIPFELLTRRRFMHYYCDYILAYQEKFCDKGVKIPLAIMTSDDTHEQTIELLEKNNYFGMDKQQITIMKQQKVPAMIDNSARFALQKDRLLIDTKPHGHGDVHTLLYQHKLIENWHKQGKKWVIFFQDTNPLVFRSYPMLLGVSQQKDFDFNSIATPRKPGEAVGAITTLVSKHDETKKLIINVEYNMLEGLFKEMGGEPKDAQGYSLYPGNINSFAIKISSYNEALNKTKGHISQFINPKYADQTKTVFKSSARLECLMQDYPKLLPNCDKVGFTDIPKGLCFSTVKNDLKSAVDKVNKGLSGESASTCEAEFNFFNRVLLRMCGAQIEECEPVQAGEIKLPLFPMIYLSPHFATCYTQLKKKVKKFKVSARSSVAIHSDCVLQDVQIDGDEDIIEDGNICLKVDDKAYRDIIPLKGDEEPYLQIRGYDLEMS